MPYDFEQTPLWLSTLARTGPDDPHDRDRETLRAAFLHFRTTVRPFAESIASSLPLFTEHGIAHADALWEIAGKICGTSVTLNPAEAFVLGGAFLLHDLGMGLAVYPGGDAELRADPSFPDLVADATRRRETVSSAPLTPIQVNDAQQEALAYLLRRRHARRAEELVETAFPHPTSPGQSLHILDNAEFRDFYGPLIGQIAHSHWWSAADLPARLPRELGAHPDLPAAWTVDPLKVACVLRLADAAHIDRGRAPLYLHAFRKPTEDSADHWAFQARLAKPSVRDDRLVYTDTRPFRRDEAAAWWLAYDTIHQINAEFRAVDSLMADLARPRFAVRSVAGADAPDRLAAGYIRVDGWKPIDASLRVTQPVQVIARLGGKELYGDNPEVALRELIANATDAVLARGAAEQAMGQPHGRPGLVTVEYDKRDDGWWIGVHDNGIGMDAQALAENLTDFANSQWRSPVMNRHYPGAITQGFQPIGRFGIGFFSIFMAADIVQVTSLPFNKGPEDTNILEFPAGLIARPLLREAKITERLTEPGTVVRARIQGDLNSFFGRNEFGWSSIAHQLMHLCKLSRVSIELRAGAGSTTKPIVIANEWKTISSRELLSKHLEYNFSSESAVEIFSAHSGLLLEDTGRITGRVAFISGFEAPVLQGTDGGAANSAKIYAGGLYSNEIHGLCGVLEGEETRARRSSAHPAASSSAVVKWLNSQHETALVSHLSTPLHQLAISQKLRDHGLGTSNMIYAVDANGTLTLKEIESVLEGLNEIVIVNLGTIRTDHESRLAEPFLPTSFQFHRKSQATSGKSLLIASARGGGGWRTSPPPFRGIVDESTIEAPDFYDTYQVIETAWNLRANSIRRYSDRGNMRLEFRGGSATAFGQRVTRDRRYGR